MTRKEIYTTDRGKSSKNPLRNGKVSLTEKQTGHLLCCNCQDPCLAADF